jgi:hypothetical protein
LIAWPSGNSGAVALFAPEDGADGTLAIKVEKSDTGNEIDGIYVQDPAEYGVSGLINFNSSARLTVPILGSIRTIRDFTEGGGILEPTVQNAIVTTEGASGSASYCRTWFDGTTTTCLMFAPANGAAPIVISENISLPSTSWCVLADCARMYFQDLLRINSRLPNKDHFTNLIP